jgi:hypothetical protein
MQALDLKVIIIVDVNKKGPPEDVNINPHTK